MPLKRLAFPLLACLLLGAAGPLAAEPAAPEAGLRLSEVVGRSVHGVDGEALGPIRDLLVDRRTGRIEQVLLEGDRAYPVDALMAGERGTVLLEPRAAEGAEGAAGATVEAPLVRASELLARPLRDAAGRELRIRDLVVDPLERQLRFAVLEDGNTLRIDDWWLAR